MPTCFHSSAPPKSPLASPLHHLFPPVLSAALFLLSGLTAALGVLQAQTAAPPPCEERTDFSASPGDFWSHRGHWDFGAQLGFALENNIPHDVSHIALLIAQPQVGLILRDFDRSPVRRLEIMDEGIFGNAVHPGGRLMGDALLFRMDGQRYGRFVPFFDAGAGVLRTTLDSRAPELSGGLQFSPQAGLGFQWFFQPQRALVFEYRFMHMSNAGLDPPNLGFNASMITLGFRWLRRPAVPPWKAQSGDSHNPLHYLLK